MVDILIEIVTAAMSVGSIEEAHMYASDLITIDGKTKDKRPFSITFRFTDGTERKNESP